MDWLHRLSLSHETTQAFIAYLRTQYEDQSLKLYHFKRERIVQIHIPILENECHIPESMSFAQLCESLNSNVAGVRVELMKYYSNFKVSRVQSSPKSRPQVLTTREVADKTGFSTSTIRRRARHHKIRGAIKQGRYWRFFPT